jgi:hypothetical protein
MTIHSPHSASSPNTSNTLLLSTSHPPPTCQQVHFWDYTQPGYDALGLISCTGTNFLLRARAFADAGWFPEWTLTEDFALGIELKRRGWQCRYVDAYLAVGEAPDEVRNCFQQRSRWAKGHFQVFFGRGRNPAFGKGSRGLSLLMRWLYGSVVLSYFSAFLATPLLMLVPIITVWFGAFPIVINWWCALSITIYYSATVCLMYYTRALGHLKSMWFASVSNSILWWAFLKAMYRATVGRWLSGTIVFKVTAKGLQRLTNLPLRDLWMAALWFVFSLVSLIFGLVHYIKGGVLDSPLAISLLFMTYNLIPQYLLLQYAAWSPRGFFNAVCRLAMLLSSALMIFGIALVWLLYPRAYDVSSALGSSLYFFDSQRVGELPAGFRVDFRASAFPQEAAAAVYLAVNPNDTLLASGGGGFGGGGFGGGGFGGGGADFFGGDPFGGGAGGFPGADPFGRRLAQADPFAVAVEGGSGTDLLAPPAAAAALAAAAGDPFAAAGAAPAASGAAADPFAAAAAPAAAAPGAAGADALARPAAAADPFADAALTPALDGAPGGGPADPFAAANPGAADPFAPTDPLDAPARKPGAPGGATRPRGGSGGSTASDLFGSDPFSAGGGGSSPFGSAAFDAPELATPDPWDLSGGWVTGMAAGNLKATAPLAFSTAVLAWGYMAFPAAYEAAGQADALRAAVRVGADYLAKVHRCALDLNFG